MDPEQVDLQLRPVEPATMQVTALVDNEHSSSELLVIGTRG